MFSKRAVLLVVAGGTAAAGVGVVAYSLRNYITPSMPKDRGAGLPIHAPKLNWTHGGFFDALDVASVRRGYKVYKEVCRTCHSLKYIRYFHLADGIMTLEEAKQEALDAQIPDLDSEGQPTTRSATLADALPSPYANRQQAEYANNGANPPDLSLMVLARHGHEDYIYALLTSYSDAPPPEGIDLGESLTYNPYFEGGVIGMPQPLTDDEVEFADGTPSTISQMAKDVSTFLRWTSEPFHDDRKRYGIKAIALAPFVFFLVVYWKRRAWSFIETQKIFYRTAKGRLSAASPPKPIE